MRKQKGITLIALVITIIVLLILAAVSITALTDEDKGVVTKAKQAASKTEDASDQEDEDIKEIIDYADSEDWGNVEEEEVVLGNASLEETTISMSSTTVWTGSGTESSPYVIGNLGQLAYLAKQVNSGNRYTNTYFKLNADIDASGYQWVPIGNNKDRYFDGIFDGQNYTIVGIETTSPFNYRGLFGFTGSNSQIKNLTINDSIVGSSSVAAASNGDFSGLLVGYNRGVIENCHVNNTMSIANNYAGGLVGYNTGDVSNCSVSNTTVQGTSYVGGCIGYNTATISDTEVSSVSVEGSSNSGPVFGKNLGSISNVMNDGVSL